MSRVTPLAGMNYIFSTVAVMRHGNEGRSLRGTTPLVVGVWLFQLKVPIDGKEIQSSEGILLRFVVGPCSC